MSARSLNKCLLIGNLTRDPEMRYTPQGTAVCTFGLATNRTWVTDQGDKKEETEFHRIVAWNKLAELCSQLLFKGRRIYVEGRLQTRQWTGQDGQSRQATEIVIEDMIVLDSKRQGEDGGTFEAAPRMNQPQAQPQIQTPEVASADQPAEEAPKPAPRGRKKTEETPAPVSAASDDVAEDIPF